MRVTALWVAIALLCSTAVPGQAQMPDKEALKKRASEVVSGRTLYEWSSDLKDRDPSVKEIAIATIKAYGEAARQYVPDIIRAITDSSDVSLKVNAVITLGYIGMDDKDKDKGINALIGCLRNSQGIVRFQAARALGNLGSSAGPAVPYLAGLIKDPVAWEIREAAANALGTAGWSKTAGASEAALNALTNGLYDHCVEVRLQSIFSLILLGTPANALTRGKELQAFRSMTHEKERDKIVIWAHVAIMRIEDKVTEEHLLVIAKYLRHPNAATRVHAARALGTIGPKAKSRVSDLIEALDDKDTSVVSWACIALGMIGNDAKAAIPKLEKLAKEHPDQGVRDNAKKAIDLISTKIRNLRS
jgi:HEAT repeat protein